MALKGPYSGEYLTPPSMEEMTPKDFYPNNEELITFLRFYVDRTKSGRYRVKFRRRTFSGRNLSELVQKWVRHISVDNFLRGRMYSDLLKRIDKHPNPEELNKETRYIRWVLGISGIHTFLGRGVTCEYVNTSWIDPFT